MEKKKQRLLLIGWLSVAVVSRILYFFLAQGTAGDTYAYYADTIARAGSIDEPVLTSGLAYAYTETLADFLKLFGESINTAVLFQVLLQIAWLIIFSFGARRLWGEISGLIAATVLLVSPHVLFTLNTVEPVNFYMLHWSILVFLFSIFMEETAKNGWYRNNTGELYLMLIGFYMGVVCTWNYLGILLVAVMLYVLKRNHEALREGLWKQKNLQRNLQLEEEKQLMPGNTQGFILVMGMLVGMYAVLMKYTGLTGWPVVRQFYWWLDQFAEFPGRCQDVGTAWLIWLVLAFVAGFAWQIVLRNIKEKAEAKREYEEYQRWEKERKDKQKADASQKDTETLKQKTEEQKAEEEMKEGYFNAADGREIKYIDNPLPGPKKHVKKEMEFEIHDVKEAHTKDDFDFKFDDGRDFDF